LKLQSLFNTIGPTKKNQNKTMLIEFLIHM
jgi:hypothetical protein